MKVSLNEIVGMLADRVSQPFNIPLQEELKLIVNYKRAQFIQQIAEKRPEQRKFFLKYISDELIRVEDEECPFPVNDCKVLRTERKIPMPIRSSYALFEYVGDDDRTDGYTYAQPDQLRWLKHSKYTGDRPKYFYADGYVYIYNEETLETITIGGVWSDQKQLHEFKCGDELCYTDDDQYDIPDDILNTMIQDILKNELRLLLAPEEGEVTVTEQNKQ